MLYTDQHFLSGLSFKKEFVGFLAYGVFKGVVVPPRECCTEIGMEPVPLRTCWGERDFHKILARANRVSSHLCLFEPLSGMDGNVLVYHCHGNSC